MNASELAYQRLATSRNSYYQRLIERQEALDNSQQMSGSHIGHDATTGTDLIRLATDGIVKAMPISNGMATRGQVSWATVPMGSSKPITDRMPR